MSNETYNVIMCLLALLTFIVLLIDKIKKVAPVANWSTILMK